MNCDEARLVALLSGQLSTEDEQAFDEHLLTCEACWRAVREDRLARLALDQLRAPIPPGLADRVTSSIRFAETASSEARRRVRFRRPRRLVAVAVLVLAVLGGVLGWTLQDHAAGDPPQIARVVAMLSPGASVSPALRVGEHFRFGGQSLTVHAYRVEGDVVLVATSTSPFPMPASYHLSSGSSLSAWTASEGKLGMYGVNHPAGGTGSSMFLVAAMPTAQLPQVAVRLHLV